MAKTGRVLVIILVLLLLCACVLPQSSLAQQVAAVEAPVVTQPPIQVPATSTPVVIPTQTPIPPTPTTEVVVITVEPTMGVKTRVLESGYNKVDVPVDQWLGKKWPPTDKPVVVIPQPDPSTVDVPKFAQTVQNGQTGTLVGVSVPGAFELGVTQQPENQPAYVSTEENKVTQYRIPLQYGVTGLLAHNSLAGAKFNLATIGNDVVLVYGDGTTKTYAIKYIVKVQALSPSSEFSSFVYKEGTPGFMGNYQIGDTLTYQQLFNEVYTGSDHVTLQTCIEGQLPNGQWDASWGRLFVVAYPK